MTLTALPVARIMLITPLVAHTIATVPSVTHTVLTALAMTRIGAHNFTQSSQSVCHTRLISPLVRTKIISGERIHIVQFVKPGVTRVK